MENNGIYPWQITEGYIEDN